MDAEAIIADASVYSELLKLAHPDAYGAAKRLTLRLQADWDYYKTKKAQLEHECNRSAYQLGMPIPMGAYSQYWTG